MITKERIERSIERIPFSGCWIWTGCIQKKGYGHIFHQGTVKKAHRLSYEAWCGTIPPEMQVLHRCDIPSCVNPEHLFLGTTQDNLNDRQSKKRHAHGITHARAKLIERDIPIIRQLRESGLTYEEIGRRFGVTCGPIWRIINGHGWGHI